MNKLSSIILLAVVCLGIGNAHANELALKGGDLGEDVSLGFLSPDDDQERYYMGAGKEIFGEFCIESRDFVKVYILESTQMAASNLFSTVFLNADDIGDSTLKAQKETVEKTAELIRANQPVESIPRNAKEAQKQIDETTERLSLMQNVGKGVKVVLNTMLDVARTELMTKLALLRANFSLTSLKEQLTQLCQTISYDLKRQLTSRLTEYKQTLRKAASKPNQPGAAQVMAVVGKTDIDNIGCLTIGRVLKVINFCNLVNLAGPSFFAMLGYKEE